MALFVAGVVRNAVVVFHVHASNNERTRMDTFGAWNVPEPGFRLENLIFMTKSDWRGLERSFIRISFLCDGLCCIFVLLTQ